jgi:hypothetical protein
MFSTCCIFVEMQFFFFSDGHVEIQVELFVVQIHEYRLLGLLRFLPDPTMIACSDSGVRHLFLNKPL